MRRPNYDLRPRVVVSDHAGDVIQGWPAIVAALAGPGVTVVECYPGAPVDDALAAWGQHAPATRVLDTRALFRRPDAIAADLAPVLTDDRVFGRLEPIGIELFLDDARVTAARATLAAADGPVAVIGPGAAYVAHIWDRLAHVSMARWELQRRQRGGAIGSLGADGKDAGSGAAALYKRAFFVDWRVGDRIKAALIAQIDQVIDANADTPKMIAGDTWRAGLAHCTTRPIRLVPFFDPGPWGGQWMREHFGLPDGPQNYAWCFDCVPEENSLRLGFGDVDVELPALDLVLAEPRALLGDAVFARFGAEFPIRFDLLDTMGGGNLSLQVHPRADYARDRFGLTYTQDESYYLLDAEPGGVVYLGLRDDADPARMAAALQAAQAGGPAFPAAEFVNVLPARKHDHFLIPAGTIHCSGAGAMVLEVSATPYIFTFKLWDWGRLGLDGRPRPIHLDHGLTNLAWDRREAFTRAELVNTLTPLAETPDYRTERTGLHASEFIETTRTWFTGPVPFDTAGTVNVLNLVQGETALVQSPTHAFAPFEVHYAQTWILPAAVGAYTVRPSGPAAEPLGVLRAFVRG